MIFNKELMKMLVLEEKGGIVMEESFRFSNSPLNLMKTFDFFAFAGIYLPLIIRKLQK